MKKLCLICALFLSSLNSVYAAGLDISLGDESAEFDYLIDSGSLGYGGADIGFGFFYNENDDVLFNAGLMVVGNLGARKDIALGVGAKAYYAKLEHYNEDPAAVAIGGQFRYIIPSRTPVGFILELYMAPGITAFGETEKFQEFNARVELEILPSTRGYIGYREIEVEMEGTQEIELDDSFHVGVRLQF